MTDVLSVAAEARATQLLKRLLDNLIWVLLALSILSMTFRSSARLSEAAAEIVRRVVER